MSCWIEERSNIPVGMLTFPLRWHSVFISDRNQPTVRYGERPNGLVVIICVDGLWR